jgi:hypothetical protein
MVRHEILITPTPTDHRTAHDGTAAGHAAQAPGVFEIRIRGHGSWQASVIEALRVAAQAGRIRITSTGKTGAAGKKSANAVVLSGEFRGYLDAEDRWIPIY